MENKIDMLEDFKSTLVTKNSDVLVKILTIINPSTTQETVQTSWGSLVSKYALIQKIVANLRNLENKGHRNKLETLLKQF